MTAPIRRVLVLGGYGAFGGRLVELLGAVECLEIVVAGRSYGKASRFCASLPTECLLEPAAVDRDADIGASLDALAPDLVIDASGPFQVYGRDPYRVVAAAIARGIHYADLADSAAFVGGVACFDNAAKEASVFVLSGLSTCPALTAAAVRDLGRDLASIDTIAAGIAPSPAVDVGESVIRAVATYAGKPVARIQDGRPGRAHALTSHRDVTIGVPGRLPLRRRRFSLVEVPDLRLLEDSFPGVRSVWVGAAIAPPVLHRALNSMAALVRWRLLPSLLPFVPLMHRASTHFRWGEHRGGMFVTVSGRHASSAPAERSWHLTAEGARGPYIPVTAAVTVIRRCASGHPPAPGARPATEELEMQDFNRLFASLGIEHGSRQVTPDPGGSLYQRVLADAWHSLPDSLQRLHGPPTTSERPTTKWRGRARVTRGRNLLAKLVCAVFGFPRASDDVAVTVEFQRENGRETWVRDFGGQRFASVQYAGRGRYAGLLCERFGPFTFGLGTVIDKGVLRLPVRCWDCFGLRLPLWLAPGSHACEYDRNGVFHFRVDLSLPLVGPLVRYEGCFDEPLALADTAGAGRTLI